jgi:hypothetical protein
MMKTSFAFTALFVLLGASAAQAQPPDWTLKVKLGQPIFLTTESGERVEGPAGQITPDGILVATPVGVKTVRYGELRRAEKRDAKWTGAAVGAAVGFGIGLLALAADEGDCMNCNGEEAAIPMGGAVYGALIGWGIDAMVKGRTTLYDRERSVDVAIIPKRGGATAALAIRW